MFETKQVFGVPVDGVDCLVGIQRFGAELVAVVTAIDGQSSETRLDRLVLEARIAKRHPITVLSPFYLQATCAPVPYVAEGELRLIGRDERWNVPLDDWDVTSIAVTPDLRYAFANCAGLRFVRLSLARADGAVLEASSGDESFAIDISPNGKLVAVATNEAEATIAVYDVERFDRMHEIRLGAFAFHPHFTPDSTGLIVCHAEGVSRVDLQTGDITPIRSTLSEVLSCAVDPQGRYVAVAESQSSVGRNNDLVVADVQSGAEVARLRIDDLRSLLSLSGEEQAKLASQIGRAEYNLARETEAGVGVSSVTWTEDGLIVTSFVGEVWTLTCD